MYVKLVEIVVMVEGSIRLQIGKSIFFFSYLVELDGSILFEQASEELRGQESASLLFLLHQPSPPPKHFLSGLFNLPQLPIRD